MPNCCAVNTPEPRGNTNNCRASTNFHGGNANIHGANTNSSRGNTPEDLKLANCLFVAKRLWKLARDTVPGRGNHGNSSRKVRWKCRNRNGSGVLSGRTDVSDTFPGTLCRANFRCRSATATHLPVRNVEGPEIIQREYARCSPAIASRMEKHTPVPTAKPAPAPARRNDEFSLGRLQLRPTKVLSI